MAFAWMHTLLDIYTTTLCRPKAQSMSHLGNVEELGLERSASNQEPIDIGRCSCVGISLEVHGRRQLTQLSTVLRIDTSSINDPRALSDGRRDSLAKPLSNVLVDLLSLLDGRDFARSDSPNGFIWGASACTPTIGH